MRKEVTEAETEEVTAVRPQAGGPFLLVPRGSVGAYPADETAAPAPPSQRATADAWMPGASLPRSTADTTPEGAAAKAERATAEAAQATLPAEPPPAPPVPQTGGDTASPRNGATAPKGPAEAPGTLADAGPAVAVGDGAAIVPPPNAAGLKAVIPQRQLTPEELAQNEEAGLTPERSRSEAARLVAALRADVDLRQADIHATAEARKAEIAAAAAQQAASVAAAAGTQADAVRQTFAAARSDLAAGFEQQNSTLAAQAAADTALVASGTAFMIADLDTEITWRQSDLAAFASAQSREPETIAGAEQTRAEAELEAAAQEAERRAAAVARRNPGSENPAVDQRAAALEVGRRSAADIREKKTPLGDALRQKAAECSGRFDSFAEAVNAELEQARPAIAYTLEAGAASAAAAIEASRAAAAEALDQRFVADLAALEAAEGGAIARIEAARWSTAAEVQAAATVAAGEIDAQASAIATEMDAAAQEAEAVVVAAEDPYLPGIADVVVAARAAVGEVHASGAAQLSASVAARADLLAELAASGAEGFAAIANAAQALAEDVLVRAMKAASGTVAGSADQGRQTIATLSEQQQGFRTAMLAEADASITRARGEMTSVNDRVRADMRTTTDDAIAEAIKPLTDDVGTRAEAAAKDAGASWWEGILSAIGELVLGFLVFVALAVLVAIVFGLTLGTAMLVVGAIMLVGAVVLAYMARSEQLAAMGIESGPGFLVLLALSDATGITFIAESFTGADLVTGQRLSEGERWRRGIIGWVTAISIVFGARAAMKGPAGGSWTRPTSILRGRENLSWKALGENAKGLWGEVRKSVHGLRDWASRWGRRAPPEAPEGGPAHAEKPSGDVARPPADEGGGSVGAARFSKIRHVEGLKARLVELRELIETLPESSARRAELLAEAERLVPEADRIAGRARAAPDEATLNSEQPAIDRLDQRIGELESQADTEIARLGFDPEPALLEHQARGFRHRVREMEAAVRRLPSGADKALLDQRLKALKKDVQAIDDLLGNRPQPQEILSLRDDIVIAERGLTDLAADIEILQPGSGAADFNARDFADRIRQLPTNERVALVESTAERFASRYGWEYDNRLSRLNNRSVYRDPASGELYGVDTQHGTFERCSPSGKHMGEYNFLRDHIDPADPSGRHDLHVR
jgi:hypothetical protein